MRLILIPLNSDSDNTEFYWGIIPRLEQKSLNLKLLEGKIKFSEILDNHNFSARFDYALDSKRAGAIRLIKDNKNWSVLEIGSGYGGITAELSDKFGKVDAIDASKELLEFAQIRLTQQNVKNVELTHVLPFEQDFLRKFNDSQYDLIVINGVLEWVGSGVKEGKPSSHQQIFLTKCAEKLKPSGFIFLAIENRWYPRWWLRDPHTKVPLTTILPRRLASVFMKLKYGSDYRTWIYSRFGLLRIAKKSRLTIQDEIYTLLSYRAPLVARPKSEFQRFRQEVGFKFQSTKWTTLLSNRITQVLFPYVIPTFIFILKKSDTNKPNEERGLLETKI